MTTNQYPTPVRNEMIHEMAHTLVLEERLRQILKWSPEHDDEHVQDELAIAAAQLAIDGTGAYDLGINLGNPGVEKWTHTIVAKHRGNRLTQLVVAGALLLAEIERLLRAATEPDELDRIKHHLQRPAYGDTVRGAISLALEDIVSPLKHWRATGRLNLEALDKALDSLDRAQRTIFPLRENKP